jgi:hypothetical protein
MSKHAVSITGANQNNDRQKDDFYATTPECVTSLLAVENQHLKGHHVLEPCCGDGAISKLLVERGFTVTSSDLVERGYGQSGVDFLAVTSTECTAIVTNPPFKLSEEFIVHALEVLRVPYLALLLKSQYWHATRRRALFEKHPPAVVYPMTWRPDFLHKGKPTMDCQWTVWRPSTIVGTLYRPLARV